MAPASGMLANNRRPSNGADSTLRMLGAAAAAAGAGAGVGSVDRPCMRHRGCAKFGRYRHGSTYIVPT